MQAFVSSFLSFKLVSLPGSSARLFIIANTTVADAAAPRCYPRATALILSQSQSLQNLKRYLYLIYNAISSTKPSHES
jgi:hypothetical protein